MPQKRMALLIVTFTKSATKTTKRRYDDRNIRDVFDVVYDTYGRDGCSVNACHRCWLEILMRSYPQYFLLPQHYLMALLQQLLLLKVPPKLRSEPSLAITTIATHQTCLMLFTTLTAVIGAALTPVMGGGRYTYLGALVSSTVTYLCWKGLVENALFSSSWRKYRKGNVVHH